MIAIERLQIFLNNVDNAILSSNDIEALGADLVEEAAAYGNHTDILWQAGVFLLLYIPNDDIDYFYEKYGYHAILKALFASLENGDFPQSLGFLTQSFLPDNRLPDLIEHMRTQQLLERFSEELSKLPTSNFAASSPELRTASAQFLNAISCCGIAPSICLQMAARL